MNLAFASLIFCLLCIDYSCGGPNFKITQCSNSTGDNSNGICDSCVKYDHNKDLKFCSSKLQLCKFEFNSTNFTWRYNKTFCEADSISIVLYNENIRDNRFVEGCCGVKLEQMSCQPKHCEPSEQLVYFVQDKNKKMLCAHQYYHTIKCPVREQQQPKDFIWYCANGTAEQQDFRKRFNATCFVYDKLNDKYTFRDEVHTEYTSQKGFITHKKSGMWNAFKEACIFYLNEETVLKYAHNSSGKAVDLLFQRQAFDMRTLPKEFVDNCTIQKFGNASSFFDMTSPTNDYICMRKWSGFQFRCIEPEVTKAVDNRPEVSANTEFTFIVVIVAVVGMIFLAFLVYFGFPVCAVQVKLFKDTKKIDPVTQGMFNRSDLKYIFVDSKEKEIYESGFAVQAVQHPCKETNRAPLSSQAVYDAPAAPNAFQEGNGCLTEGMGLY
uniref:uncharacterized protein LOC100177757 isoform X2 n=1 Tax=Ciona intestinalis TaxID=7719 RepID=UPI0005211DBD|nr:uncharacterized protein LOC100177757 isoform X2 [Ciona intestinalis]|eukprot:XP_026693953.1 uncharacterized protein LOC100177757 isoform X2 [Ciona intestinalis]